MSWRRSRSTRSPLPSTASSRVSNWRWGTPSAKDQTVLAELDTAELRLAACCCQGRADGLSQAGRRRHAGRQDRRGPDRPGQRRQGQGPDRPAGPSDRTGPDSLAGDRHAGDRRPQTPDRRPRPDGPDPLRGRSAGLPAGGAVRAGGRGLRYGRRPGGQAGDGHLSGPVHPLRRGAGQPGGRGGQQSQRLQGPGPAPGDAALDAAGHGGRGQGHGREEALRLDLEPQGGELDSHEAVDLKRSLIS